MVGLKGKWGKVFAQYCNATIYRPRRTPLLFRARYIILAFRRGPGGLPENTRYLDMLVKSNFKLYLRNGDWLKVGERLPNSPPSRIFLFFNRR